MKQLLSGTALAAVLAFSMPAWAQSTAPTSPSAPSETAPSLAPSTPSTPSVPQQPSAAAPQAAPSTGMPAGRTAGQGDERMPRRHMMRGHEQRHSSGQMHRRGQMHQRGPMHHRGMTRRGSEPSDNVANQLNAQEAQRLSGSSMPRGPGPAGMGPGGHSMPMR